MEVSGPRLKWESLGWPRILWLLREEVDYPESVFLARRRAVWLAIGVVAAAWAVAVGGYQVAKNSRITAEKVAAYLKDVEFGALSGEDRARALGELAEKMNALTIEERRRARMGGEWEKWFAQMTDEEKVVFIEATLPSGFKQMLESFEELPETRRRQAVERAMNQLQRARSEAEQEGFVPSEDAEGDGMERLSPELQQKVVQIGLKSFYSQSSAQTKAELAPLLEEMQHQMQSGALFRGRRREGRPDGAE